MLFKNLFQENLGETMCIYIHWPFCLSKCPYCDFNSHVSSSYDYQVWYDYYSKEIDFFYPLLYKKKVKSIFFGGGTPSLMSPDLVNKILDKIANICVVNNDLEISLEANPNSSEAKKFKLFKKAGINRISIGVQSLNQKILNFLGRKHTVKEGICAVENAKKYFDNFSIDIIYACKDHNLNNWIKELDNILQLGPKHISLYQLTLEENTKFFNLAKKGLFDELNSDISFDLLDYTNHKLKSEKYIQYEISNYSKESKFFCVHNINYWEYKNYLGIGPGAHSRIMSRNLEKVYAIENHKSPKIWFSNIDEKFHGAYKNFTLTKKEILTELLFVGLRLNKGIFFDKIKMISEKSFLNILKSKIFVKLKEEQLIQLDNSSLFLTAKGLLMHTEIVKELSCLL